MLSGALLRLSLLGVIAGAGQSATSLTGTENVYTYTSALLNGTAGANITSSDFEINVGFNVVFAEKQVNVSCYIYMRFFFFTQWCSFGQFKCVLSFPRSLQPPWS